MEWGRERYAMSMEIFAFSDRKLHSLAEWQSAIDAEGFALRVSDKRPFEVLSGFLPMQLEGRGSGCECDHYDAGEIMDGFADIEFSRRWHYVLAFRFSGYIDECICAYMAAAAYVRATEGCVLDGEEGRLLTPREAANVVRELLKFKKSQDKAGRGEQEAC
jgi:hypothetical protein